MDRNGKEGEFVCGRDSGDWSVIGEGAGAGRLGRRRRWTHDAIEQGRYANGRGLETGMRKEHLRETVDVSNQGSDI